jgi:two-component system phosphate regulon response regulator PhoB
MLQERKALDLPPSAPAILGSAGVSGSVVLVVDDERDIAELLDYLLSREGHTVHSVSSVESALLTLTQLPVDLVLTDYMMPDLDGADLLRAMRAAPELAHIPVLVLSAQSEESVRARSPDMAGFIRKPFRVEVLLSLIHSHLRDLA